MDAGQQQTTGICWLISRLYWQQPASAQPGCGQCLKLQTLALHTQHAAVQVSERRRLRLQLQACQSR